MVAPMSGLLVAGSLRQGCAQAAAPGVTLEAHSGVLTAVTYR